MPDITISCDGIQKLLDPSKASGPDNIPTRILKLCAKEVAPVIFIQSLTLSVSKGPILLMYTLRVVSLDWHKLHI